MIVLVVVSMGLGCPEHYNPADLFLERLADPRATPSASQIADVFATSSLGIALQYEASGKVRLQKQIIFFILIKKLTYFDK